MYGSADGVGGVLGWASGSEIVVQDSYNHGNVSSTGRNVGGVVGNLAFSSQVKRTYNTGRIQGAGGVGAVVGRKGENAEVDDSSYYDNETSGVGDAYGKALTTNRMKDAKIANLIFPELDRQTWNFRDGHYPDLKNNSRFR